MARRNKKTHVLELLVKAPWWISIIVGLGIWLLLAIAPTIFSTNFSLYSLATAAQSFSWVPLVLFAVVALISYVRSKKIAAKKPPLDVREEPTIKKVRRRAVPQIVIDQDMHTVLALGGHTEIHDADWTIEALCALEWKRFELLCAKYYEMIGFKAETLEAGADGGIDIKLYRQNMTTPIAIVQCKSWKSQVPVSEIRELFGVMTHEKVARGVFITTGSYTRDALMFGAANPMQLLDGETFLKKIRELDPASRQALKAFAFAGDYTTPTCASCGIKLVRRENRRGAFWGCINYPRCHMTLKIRAASAH